MKIITTILILSLTQISFAQNYTDFIGAGHMNGITVTTSHNANPANNGAKTIDGFQNHNDETLRDASRFLAQASMGYDYETIQNVATMGYEAWIEEQISLPMHSTMDAALLIDNVYSATELPEELYGFLKFRSAWWNIILNNPDILRQKVTWSLSQIFVTSAVGSDLFEDVTELSTVYYDLLQKHSFGNYRDLLSAVSRNLSMGLYLSHFNNPKSNPALNIHPDENYAREVMQLFSIGLYELNNDGSRKLDGNGKFIPTYDNDDIREFAKIFTGFGDPIGNEFGEIDDENPGLVASTPMKMFDEHHEPGQKTLLYGQIVPAGQTGLEDFEDAMDNLFNHPNVGPFIGKALIQFMTTSNPSPAYIDRVASAFNNNGLGVRGDLKAVVKAILLDPEARRCNPVDFPTSGKLREPITRFTSFIKAFNPRPNGNTQNVYVHEMVDWDETVGQTPQYSPSVFNFYQPEFQPNGVIANNNLVGPEYQIHNSSTAIGFINNLNEWVFNPSPFPSEFEATADVGIMLDYSDELALINNPSSLVNRLDILLGAGLLSQRTKTIISDAITQLDNEDRLPIAIYLIMMSPDYAVLK
jgi:uncharacterized protein (DUF1800 family)